MGSGPFPLQDGLLSQKLFFKRNHRMLCDLHGCQLIFVMLWNVSYVILYGALVMIEYRQDMPLVRNRIPDVIKLWIRVLKHKYKWSETVVIALYRPCCSRARLWRGLQVATYLGCKIFVVASFGTFAMALALIFSP
ncbi:hypothetical protein V6N11_083841 [Hibiscus sabdariffa]|uniref:Uncharacterized protein n=1 Tax=Hibiscus sabdariffa TaxID=183260 RepID=A0ABR2QCP0_9ROSI